jgi:dGTPase
VVKHNGPITDRLERPAYKAIGDYTLRTTWRSHLASAEAQVAALADDIAYNNHDVDDGSGRAVQPGRPAEVPLIGPLPASCARATIPGWTRMLRLEAVRRMIGVMVDDSWRDARRRPRSGVTSRRRRSGHGRAGRFSTACGEDLAKLRGFLHARMYRHYRMNRTAARAADPARVFELLWPSRT